MTYEISRITTKVELSEWLNLELVFYPCGIIQRIIPISEKAILRKHQLLLRKTEYHTNRCHRIRASIYKLRLLKIQNRHSLHIPLNCCGKGLHIMHLGPILINSNTKVGQYCSIHINSAFVANGVSSGAPKIGNGVVVGVGAVLLGEIFVANNVAIGANAVVNKSIYEENIAIAGVPAKKVSSSGTMNWNK